MHPSRNNLPHHAAAHVGQPVVPAVEAICQLFEVQPDELQIINTDADFLAQHPNMKLVISGHCDERGSEDYNMGLGENRASTVRDILVKHGVTTDSIKVISYGKEKPFCTAAENESCWQQNRRAHFALSN